MNTSTLPAPAGAPRAAKKPVFVEVRFHTFGWSHNDETSGTIKTRIPPGSDWKQVLENVSIPRGSSDLMCDLARKLRPLTQSPTELHETVLWEGRGGTSSVSAKLIWE